MPRTTYLLATAATVAPLALGAGSLLGSSTISRAKLSAATIAALTTSSTQPKAISLAAAATAKPLSLITPSFAKVPLSAALAAKTRIFLSPAVQMHMDAQDRARAYLEACATDSSFGGHPSPRSLSDSIATIECGRRATENDPWGPVPWQEIEARVDEGIANLNARSDAHPPDFDANDLLRLVYAYPATPYVIAHPTVTGSTKLSTLLRSSVARSAALAVLTSAVASAPSTSAGAGASAPAAPPAPKGGGIAANPKVRLPRPLDGKIREALRNFKYWVDEGGPDDICFWSENHQILFATAEYLAGQLMPHEIFTNSGMRGLDHKNKARGRLLRWLDERLKFGFSEWNSPGYYEEDFKALFNLADFCDDPAIQKRASMVLDLMIFDLARFTHQGSFGVTSGRCYEKLGGDGSQWKHSGWRQSVGEIIQVLFGTRGRFNGTGAVSALYYATSSYKVPTVLLSIGKDTPDHFVEKARVGIDPEEAKYYGIGFDGLDDGMFWWSKAAYVSKWNIANTRRLMNTYGISNMRSNINDTLDKLNGIFWWASDDMLRTVADDLSPITEGMNLTKANLYCYRNKDVMLSSAQDYHRGQVGPQQQIWQATLGMDQVVYTTLPGKRESDGPGYWTGSAALPSAIQFENTCIIAYDAPMIVKLKEGLHRTHAFFPKDKFDEFDRRRGSNLHGAWGVTSSGTWIFGRKGDGYIALYSNEGYDNGPTDWVAAGSWTNVFICQVGNAAEFGNFDNFKNQVTNARIYIHYPHVGDWSPVYCGYDIPGKGRLELHYGSNPSYNGQAFDVHNFARFENNYTTVPWDGGSMGIRNAGFELIHLRDTTDPQHDPKYDVRIGSGL